MFLQLLANGLVMGSIYALVSLGFALIYNTTRIFHIAYAAIYMFSAYMFYLFYNLFHFQIVLSFIISIFLTVILSLVVEKLVYYPIQNRQGSLNVVMIGSIGVMIIIVNSIAMFFGNETKIINQQISSSLSFGNILLTKVQIAQFIIAVITIISFLLILKYSNFGIKTRAMRDDDILCTVFGIRLTKVRAILFALSAFFAALASVLVAYDVGMDPYVGLPMLLNAVVALIIGGIGRFEAPVLGGFFIGILQAIAVWAFSSRWQDAVTFALLLLFLLFRPQGFLGEKRRLV